jgi:FkbM family methyltransferase
METGSLIQPHELAAFDRSMAEHEIRRRARAVYLGRDTALVLILGRYKFFLDTLDLGFGSHVVLDGFWEIWLTLFCARNLKSGMTAIDVGAHYGYYSMMFADFIGASGSLISIEPNPRAGELLGRSLELNGFAGRSRVMPVVAGAPEDCQASLFIPPFESKNALVVADTSGLSDRGAIIQVQSVCLDKVCAQMERVDFVKIDAEGSEERIFEGMCDTIRRFHPLIVMEFNALRYSNPGAFLERMLGAYGSLCAVDFDGSTPPVSPEDLLTKRLGEDWLVVLSRNRLA